MSAQEIIAELPKLKPDEFRLVQEKVEDLAKAKHQLHARIAGHLASPARESSGRRRSRRSSTSFRDLAARRFRPSVERRK
jgi:hypothetical protein